MCHCLCLHATSFSNKSLSGGSNRPASPRRQSWIVLFTFLSLFARQLADKAAVSSAASTTLHPTLVRFRKAGQSVRTPPWHKQQKHVQKVYRQHQRKIFHLWRKCCQLKYPQGANLYTTSSFMSAMRTNICVLQTDRHAIPPPIGSLAHWCSFTFRKNKMLNNWSNQRNVLSEHWHMNNTRKTAENRDS